MGTARGVPSGFFPQGTYDLFFTHAWRYTDEWQTLVGAFDEFLPGKWRNWSLPWYDTSIESHTPEGKLQLERLLNGQIEMASAVILLPEINARVESQDWMFKELAIAAQYQKPVIGVIPQDAGSFPVQLKDRVDTVTERDPKSIIEALDRIIGAKQN